MFGCLAKALALDVRVIPMFDDARTSDTLVVIGETVRIVLASRWQPVVKVSNDGVAAESIGQCR